MFEPWLKSAYEGRRLLLLGESAYSWQKDGETVHPATQHCIELVEQTIEGENNRSFMMTLTRGIAKKENPSRDEKRAAWQSVAFTNYVGSTVGLGPDERPSEDQWRQAALDFPKLLEDIKPQHVIVLGKTMWSKIPEMSVYLTDDVQAYKRPDGGLSLCWAVQHPRARFSSSPLSWDRLMRVIAFAEGRELVE